MKNIIDSCNDALWNKTLDTGGLNRYTQANCQVTLTDDGYRIYRPPNKTVSSDGNTMWGGLIIRPFNADSNAMVKGHTYVLKFDVKGKTSNAVADAWWSNNAGWGGGGLSPSPSNVSDNKSTFGANFQSDKWIPYSYTFTINDDIYKVCTSSYSSFVQGQTYLSYRDFKFGFGYTDTGTMGTDLYLKNFKLYDITTKPNSVGVTSQGIVHASNFTESGTKGSVYQDSEIYGLRLHEI